CAGASSPRSIRPVRKAGSYNVGTTPWVPGRPQGWSGLRRAGCRRGLAPLCDGVAPSAPSREATMADIVSSSPRPNRRPVVVLAVAVGALLAATIALWAHYGTAVFFEMIRAGFAACL